MKAAICVCLCLHVGALAVAEEEKSDKTDEWVSIFNGKNLDGWTPKIRYHKLGDNVGDTFRVRDGNLVVAYDKPHYQEFNETFGHLFYKTKYSHYRFRMEYRFVDEQVKGGPGWAFRNSGIMLHCQDPATMAKDQEFPVSIEVQLLGGSGTGERHTANLCTPGTNVVMEEKLIKRHCINSKSKTYHGDQWVKVEVEVRGDKLVRHLVDGKEVMHYEQPQLDPTDADAKKILKDGKLRLSEGYISLQSESHPVEFRKIEVMRLAKD